MAPAQPKLNLGQRLLAKWATRKVGKQLRDGNPRPVHGANIASPLVVVLGLAIAFFRLWVFGILLVGLGVGLGIAGVMKSGKNKEYAGEGLGIAGIVLGGLWLLLAIVAWVAISTLL
jgi:hypothetical protein